MALRFVQRHKTAGALPDPSPVLPAPPVPSPAAEKPEPPAPVAPCETRPAACECGGSDLYPSGSTIALPGKAIGLWCRACDRLVSWLTKGEAATWAAGRRWSAEPEPDPQPAPTGVSLVPARDLQADFPAGVVVTDAEGRPIAHRVRELPRQVGHLEAMPTPVDLLRAGWTDRPGAELTAHRIWAALAAIPGEPFELARGHQVQDPEKWQRALAADALQGPAGARARSGALLADVDLIERWRDNER